MKACINEYDISHIEELVYQKLEKKEFIIGKVHITYTYLGTGKASNETLV